MRNISDIIEQYLKEILQTSGADSVEIQRNELADRFQCVPSQINYVISTRFTPEKGYSVESKRGGRGYVRIQKIRFPDEGTLHEHCFRSIGLQLDQQSAEGLIYRLHEAGILRKPEAELMKAAVSREALRLPLPLRDEIRANLVKAMLVALLGR